MTTVAIPKSNRSTGRIHESGALTGADLCKAHRIEKHRTEAAKQHVDAYRILSCEGPAGHLGMVSIVGIGRFKKPVVVDTLHDTCTCNEHFPDGIVTRHRRHLLGLGFSVTDLLVRSAWPHCEHQLIVTLKEMENPEEFDHASDFFVESGKESDIGTEIGAGTRNDEAFQ